jgi:hypothetical protein
MEPAATVVLAPGLNCTASLGQAFELNVIWTRVANPTDERSV